MTRISSRPKATTAPTTESPQIRASQVSSPQRPSLAQMAALLAPFNQGQTEQCIVDCRQFIRQFPQHYFGYKLLGACYEEQGKLFSAIKAMQKAAQLQPKDIENMANLAKVYKDVGRREEALDLYEKALSLDPNHIELLAKYLFSLNYANITPAEKAFELAQRYGQLMSQAASHHYHSWHVHTNNPIRIGLVSGDLSMHPVGFFLEHVLAHLDPSRIHITAYPTDRKTDHVTERLRQHCHAWTPIYDLSDSVAAQRIHGDQIDILMDLSGLTANHRLGVFAHKPAPMQVSWLGYFATTGLPEMDYILADKHSIGAAQEHYFTEKVLHMPRTRLCYGATHLKKVNAVSPLPALKPKATHLTLGCFQNISKITDKVLDTWARILQAIPHAHLRLQCKQFASSIIQTEFHNRCTKHGLEPSRLSLRAPKGLTSYMNSYAEVDFLLDTFPFPGGTTTCEALWMGVPTLTLCGDRMISRQGASLMHAAGLDDWIAHDLTEYERKAIAFANNLPALAQLRAHLREQVRISPLFDAQHFAHDFTQLLTETYHKHAAKQ